MAIKRYKKLIRDRILEIIKEAGEIPYWRVLTKGEYHKELKKKLVEESRELLGAKGKRDILNELTDIQELIDTILEKYDISKSELRKSQRIKNKKRGAFKKRLLLIRTKN